MTPAPRRFRFDRKPSLTRQRRPAMISASMTSFSGASSTTTGS
jgi:hypothetical protein